jgi:hypothetical protein
VECDQGTLTLTSLSRERAVRGRARLEELLGPLSLRSEEYRPFDPGDRPSPPAAAEPIDISNVPELQAWIEAQDRQWLDTSVPALDNRTPRQAAGDKRLRPRLRDLLIEIENQEERRGTAGGGRDVTWMWQELGLRRP